MLDTLKAPDQQGVRDILTEGFTKLTAVEMHRVLDNCGYEHQRFVSEKHVAVLTDLMSRGKWQAKSQLDFGVLNGRYILINGYHRGYAQVRSGKSIEWTIALHHVKTEDDLRPLYYAFDTNVRVRGARDILKAYEFSETTGLAADVAAALYTAIPVIASKFDLNPAKKFTLDAKAVDRRLALATEYAKAAARFGACLDGLRVARKKKFLSGAVTAVAVITFRYQSEAAWQFWSAVAQNDGLKRGDPRHALAMDMLSRTGKNGNSAMSFGPSIVAWNAFFEDRKLQLLRVHPETFVAAIAGTPFDGKRN